VEKLAENAKGEKHATVNVHLAKPTITPPPAQELAKPHDRKRKISAKGKSELGARKQLIRGGGRGREERYSAERILKT